MLIRLVYVSEIVGTISDIEIQVILGQAQMRNRRLDVTGMLVQSDGHFLQVLEGRPAAVEEIRARIERNPRHRALRILTRDSINKRTFAFWAMALIRRDDLAAEMRDLHLNGYLPHTDLTEVLDRMLVLRA